MKILLTLATLIFAATAQATPAVGDYGNYDLTLTQASSVQTGSYELSLVSQAGANFEMQSVITIGGQPQSSQETVAASDLLSDATITAVLGNCAQYGGQSAQITVPAGSFATCALPIDGGVAWIGQVPFGVIQQSQAQSNGSNLVLKLQSFVFGK